MTERSALGVVVAAGPGGVEGFHQECLVARVIRAARLVPVGPGCPRHVADSVDGPLRFGFEPRDADVAARTIAVADSDLQAHPLIDGVHRDGVLHRVGRSVDRGHRRHRVLAEDGRRGAEGIIPHGQLA